MEQINIEHYKKLISQNKSDQLCEDLLSRINQYLRKDQNSELQEIYDNLIMITGKLKGIRDDEMINIITSEDAEVEESKVNQSLIKIINRLPLYYFDFVNSGGLEINESKDIRKNIYELHSNSPFEYDAFFSYSSNDYEEAKKICEELRGYGLKIFLSGEALKSTIGSSIFDKKEEALGSSHHFILLSSVTSMNSGWVKAEYETFYNEFFIPSKGKRKFLIVEGKDHNQEFVPTLLRRLQIADSPKEIIDTFLKERELISEDVIDEKKDNTSKEKKTQESKDTNITLDKSNKRPSENQSVATRIKGFIKRNANWLFIGLSLIFILLLILSILGNRKVKEPLLFEWNKERTLIDDDWNERRQALLDTLKSDDMLEITGLYRSDESTIRAYENLGIARADDVANLFKPPLTDDRIIIGGKMINEEVTDTTALFKGVEFRILNFKEIDAEKLIYFPINSENKFNDSKVKAYLDDVAKRVKNTGEKVRLTGHTDNVGSSNDNQSIGMRMANTVKSYLIDKGVRASKIITQSKGETQPIATNENEAGRAQNRRTELEVIK